MEGGSLAHNLRAKKVSWWRRGKKVAMDVARALVYLHSRRIIHLGGCLPATWWCCLGAMEMEALLRLPAAVCQPYAAEQVASGGRSDCCSPTFPPQILNRQMCC
jgi:hypothetical protein